jgi:hypothetical protein
MGSDVQAVHEERRSVVLEADDAELAAIRP